MPIKEENLVLYPDVIKPGQRLMKIGETFVPVGFGGNFEPGAISFMEEGRDTYYKCASVGETTWDGYALVLGVDGYYTVSETLTTGLSYGIGYTPKVDGVYNANATVSVGKYWNGAISYKYLHFQIRATKSVYIDVVQMSEFKLIDNSGAEVSLSSLGEVTVTASPNSTSSSESLTNLIDGDVNTKWCNTAYTPPTNVYFEFSEPVDNLPSVYKGYCWYTANDGSGRDPVSWTIFVSENGNTWEQIAKVENASITDDRNALAGTWTWDA